MNNKKFCILFAGAIGSSKTPIANYLSGKLNLPVFNNDAIRAEVIEDLGELNFEEHIKRRDSRLKELLEKEFSFIIDLSIDREWKKSKDKLTKNGFDYFIISLDLSKDFLENLYKLKNYSESLKVIEQFVNDHNLFLEESGNEIGLHIDDKNFKDRLDLSFQAVNNWLRNIENKV